MAGFFAAQPPERSELTLTLQEFERILGDDLPRAARLPYFWRNDEAKIHARAWLSAGWKVARVSRGCSEITFVRHPNQR